MSELTKHDDDLARFLRDDAKMGDEVRYDHNRSTWHWWNKWRWQPDTTERVYKLVSDHALSLARAAEGEKQRLIFNLFDQGKKESVLKSLRHMDPVAMSGSEWNPDPVMLGVKNGVLDLTTLELHTDPHPDWLITRSAAVEWNAKASCPQFIKFLGEIMGDDPTLVDYLLRVLGYSLYGWQREQKFWLWVGAGTNGKGTLAKVVSRVLGDYADTPSAELYMRTKFGSTSANAPRAELVRLQGVRFTWMSEPQGGAFNDEMVKAHTGDDPITARDLYAKAAQTLVFRPTHTLNFLTNDPPRIEDVGPSMRRRVRVIKFERDFTLTMDPGLEDRLVREEGPGIFRLLAIAANSYMTDGLPEPDLIRQWSAQYIEENDPVARFVSERCVISSTAKMPSSLAYDAYIQWCRENGDEPKSGTGFGLAMSKRYDKFRLNTGMVYKGVGLKSAMTVAMEEGDGNNRGQ